MKRAFLRCSLLLVPFCAMLALLGRGGPSLGPLEGTAFAAPPAIELKVVKYPELTKFVRAQKGKVVVVDFWGEFCVPCKKEFPHLVELHNKHAAEGLVCASVTIDPNKSDKKEKALAFLQKVGATFPNFLLDEPPSYYQDRLNFNGVPVVFVFDRQGRRAAKFDNENPDKPFNYTDDVIPLVEKLLKEKP